MAMKEMVIEVNGLPDNYPQNMMIDKLTMHFLRPSNKGGEVLTVIYPTSNEGQAYVVFESAEVPGVLQHTHVLIVESQFYPLDIKKVHHPQLDMPAEAFLNMNMFSRHSKIKELLHNHGFHVSETSQGQLHLQGSFLKLKLIYPKLLQFLVQETHPQRGTPSHYTNGFSDSLSRAEKYDSSDYESRPNFTSRRSQNNGNSMYAEGRSTSSGITSRSPESLQNASLLNGSSSSESTFSSPRSFEDSRTTIFQQSSLSPRQTEESIHVDPDVWEYAKCFKEDFIKKIKSDHHTHINHKDESGVVMVKLSGGNYREAAEELSELMQEITLSLRTHEIDLNQCDQIQKRNITQKVYSFQKINIYNVLIKQHNNIIKVVGSSKDSYEAKQKLLGLDVDIAPPKRMERNILRRSSSLPRQNTRTRVENLDVDQVPGAVYTTTVSSSSASYSRTDYQSQQEVKQERGRQPSKSAAQRRSQSGSRLQHKNQNREKQEPSTNVQQDVTPSSGVQRSKQGRLPTFKGSLMPDIFKSKLKLHK